MIAHTCTCGARLEPGQVCACRASRCLTCQRPIPTGAFCPEHAPKRSYKGRTLRQPYRAAYSHPSWKRVRMERYHLTNGTCESCGVILKGPLHPREGMAWEGDHLRPASDFADPIEANTIENTRVRCTPCHKRKTRLVDRKRRRR